MSPKKRGSPIARQTIATARAARSAKRHGANAAIRSAIATIQRGGVVTLGGIARALEARGIQTPGGGLTWRRVQVARLVQVIQRDTVPIVVACDSVFLPLDVEGNVPADWQSAPNASKVKRGTRLQAPAELAASLVQRGQAVIEPLAPKEARRALLHPVIGCGLYRPVDRSWPGVAPRFRLADPCDSCDSCDSWDDYWPKLQVIECLQTNLSAKQWLQFGASFPPKCSRLSSRQPFDRPAKARVRNWQSTFMPGIPGHRLATSRGERCLSQIALAGSSGCA